MECRLLRFKLAPVDGSVPEPENPALLQLTEEFWRREFPDKPKPEFGRFSLVWVVIEEVDGVTRVVGATAVTYLMDLPCFHSQSARAYALMFRRLHEWALDRGIPLLSVYVQQENVEKIKSLMERCNAKVADRWLFDVVNTIEVK